jgi:hypothetical protein
MLRGANTDPKLTEHFKLGYVTLAIKAAKAFPKHVFVIIQIRVISVGENRYTERSLFHTVRARRSVIEVLDKSPALIAVENLDARIYTNYM